MKWRDKVKFALRAAVHDLFGEEEFAPAQQDPAALAAGRERLEALRRELAPAVAREKRAQLEERKALAEAQALNQTVDEALVAGQEEPAARKLRQAQQALARAAEARERYQAYAQATAALRDEITRLAANLDALGRQLGTLSEREASVGTVEKLQTLRREQRQDSRELGDDLEARKERLARREDKTAAREEMEKRD
ncbi:MAG: hypothetical protein L0332_31275 [Chloroflexi bacterium]|nr:hypothetical protein [Chloroflexota bacterium]MCI0574870.1 hypothetical protein [Chloroflexota bacterium]MCI0650100.1 hypothetical protein [Chloroflexota bacterium]MCI0731184.1 hypothetical protein [Chloroflexota bacterium]